MLTRTRAAVVALLAGAVLALGMSPSLVAPVAAATATISGTVTGERGVDEGHVFLLSEQTEDGETFFDYADDTEVVLQGGAARYSFAGLAPGRYQLLVFASADGRDYAATWSGGTADPEAAETLTLDSTDLVADVAMVNGFGFSGTVEGPAGAAEGVDVTVYDTDGEYVDDVMTEADGTFTISGLLADDYVVEFDGSGADGGSLAPEYWDDQRTFETADVLSIGQGQEPDDVDAVLASASRIRGSVVVDRGDPSDVSVDVYRDGDLVGQSMPEPDGTYVVDGLAAGTYTVGFNREQDGPFAPEMWKDRADSVGPAGGNLVNVPADGSTTLPAATISTGAVLTGRVLDRDGLPVEEAYVVAYGPDGAMSDRSSSTSAGGAFRIAGLVPGAAYYVRVSHYPEDLDNPVLGWYPGGALSEENASTTIAPAAGGAVRSLGDVRLGLSELSSTSGPTVAGSTKVGQRLTATQGAWSEPGVAPVYQWLANGAPVSGATQSTYVLRPADLGKRVTVRITGTKPGFAPVITESAQTGIVAAGTVTPARPTISGTAAVGRTLTASVTGLPTGVSPVFTWLSGGKAVTTGRTYTVRIGDIGRTLTVQVTGQGTGYTSNTTTSAATGKVAKAPSRTTLTAKGAKKRKATLTVAVSATGTTSPGGTVTIKDGSRSVKTVTVPRGGRVVVTLKRLKVGKHTFTAVYNGSAVARGSSASAGTTVKK